MNTGFSSHFMRMKIQNHIYIFKKKYNLGKNVMLE